MSDVSDQGSTESTIEPPVASEIVQGESTSKNPFIAAQDKTQSATTSLDNVSDFAKGVLKGVDPSLLPSLAPFVSEWDRNYQKSVNDIKSQYSGFDGMTPEDAKSAYELQQLIFSNPKAALELISQQANLTQDEDQPTSLTEDEEDIIASLPPEIRERLEKVDKLEQIVKLVADAEISRTQQAREASESKEYDSLLETLATKHGAFDTDYVNMAVATGANPEDAVTNWHVMANKIATERLKAHNDAPNVLGGQGGVKTSGGVELSKLSATDRKAYVAKMLQASNND